MKKRKPRHKAGIFRSEWSLPLTRGIGGGSWIRTSESSASRFTVCPLWPTRESHPVERWLLYR